eukprot:CAMPEP_0182873970 /NCGR_PEP_ID=MMETSP0034_2-20130328/12655_1 /TAXON_ID=156128 /ORGANISM="Nephroselmis pyriformis, Strain CCMP717" /LENGTH=77 /DNA_ID=CAMNT_0025006655 /DNA_START=78 /DNA_END=307 /DNA_ORIENTATION=+
MARHQTMFEALTRAQSSGAVSSISNTPRGTSLNARPRPPVRAAPRAAPPPRGRSAGGAGLLGALSRQRESARTPAAA